VDVTVVDVTVEAESGAGESGPVAAVKPQGESWEVNVRAAPADLLRLRGIRAADWDARRSLAIGVSAGAPVYWAARDGRATILIGHDDETWDIAVVIPLATVEEIASLAAPLV
jgi:hypothetical protein